MWVAEKLDWKGLKRVFCLNKFWNFSALLLEITLYLDKHGRPSNVVHGNDRCLFREMYETRSKVWAV
jgi:hypothetical protein